MRSLDVVLVGLLLLGVACGGDGTQKPEPATDSVDETANLDTIVRGAIEAHGAGEFDRALELSLQAEGILPGHPRLIYNTACALAATGKTEAALDRLERVAGMGITMDLEASASLEPLRGEPRLGEIVRTMVANSEPVERSSVAFTVPDRTFLVEGIAFDPATGDLFLSSLYQRRIARVTSDGEMVPFTEPGDNMWSMLGMVVDTENGHLWTITIGGPRMAGAGPDESLRSALVQLSLSTGVELARYPAPDDLEGSALDSLAVGRDGCVYVSDSGVGAIHQLHPDGERLEAMVPPGTFLSTQGLELSADQTVLFAADYSRGLATVDVTSGEVRFLDHDGPCLLGIDGLERHGDDLIAIQNGIDPPRVVRIVLGEDGRSIERVVLLERAHHLYREPTLGTVVDDELLYVAASQWRSFDDEGKLLQDQLIEPAILRLPLADAPPTPSTR